MKDIITVLLLTVQMTDSQKDIELRPIKKKLSQMKRTCQQYLWNAFLLGKQFGGTKPIDIDRLAHIIGKFQDLEKELAQIGQN